MVDLPVVVYAAKSTPDEKDSTGHQTERVLAAIAAEGGRTVVGRYAEENVSAYRGSRGPELEAAIAAAKRAAREANGAELWVFHSSRLARGSGLRDEARSLLEVWTDLLRAGVTVRSVEDDPFVSSSMLVGVAAEMAHKYSADLSAHVRRGKERQFDRGERQGGPVPDGYRLVDALDDAGRATRRYEPDDQRAPVVRRVFTLALDGLGAGAVARRLNAEGHRTQRGAAWNRRRVQDTLSNPFYAGLAVIHRGTPEQRVTEGRWPALVARGDFDRVAALTAKRDQAAKGRKPEGRRTTRYALAKLGVCDRCGARMYAVTSPYKRKDGTQQRRYVCANVHGTTGTCDQAKLDAVQIDAAVIEHLNRLFIDFEAWLEEMARGAQEQRAGAEAELARELDRLAVTEGREAKLRTRYIEASLAEDSVEKAAFEAYHHVLQEREAQQRRVRALQEALAALPDEPPVDAMLDVYNDLARAVRTGDGESVGDLNDRLRAVFAEFRLDEVEPGIVGVLPVLREDVMERYGDALPVMVGPEGVKAGDQLPPGAPVVLWATDRDLPEPRADRPGALLERGGTLGSRGISATP